jgi:hypothetical protein
MLDDKKRRIPIILKLSKRLIPKSPDQRTDETPVLRNRELTFTNFIYELICFSATSRPTQTLWMTMFIMEKKRRNPVLTFRILFCPLFAGSKLRRFPTDGLISGRISFLGLISEKKRMN